MENELFMNGGASQPSPSSSPAMLNWVSMESQQMDPSLSRSLPRDCFFWEKSMEQSIFDSALSSLVSSPAPSNSNFSGGGGGGGGGGENFDFSSSKEVEEKEDSDSKKSKKTEENERDRNRSFKGDVIMDPKDSTTVPNQEYVLIDPNDGSGDKAVAEEVDEGEEKTEV